MKKPFFTIIVVSYNAGDKLLKTIDSIDSQSFTDYRIIVKDGLSTDGSVDGLREKYNVAAHDDEKLQKITLIEGCDNGIYHAMNIATNYIKEKILEDRTKDADSERTADVRLLNAGGVPSYIFFLNCGDLFYNDRVLENVHERIVAGNSKDGTTVPAIFYGDIFDSETGHKVASNPVIDDYACYRNLPSHQACFYDERLIYRNPFDLRYKVRADYEQFLRCIYREKAGTNYIPVVISRYEGAGFSAQNKKLSEQERREIIKLYLTGSQIRKYDFLRVATLTGARGFLASNKVTSGLYNSIKSAFYRRKG